MQRCHVGGIKVIIRKKKIMHSCSIVIYLQQKGMAMTKLMTMNKQILMIDNRLITVDNRLTGW